MALILLETQIIADGKNKKAKEKKYRTALITSPGDPKWMAKIVKKLELEYTIRPRGRPKKMK